MVGQQIKKIFNWKIYLKNYPELFHSGINDEKKALEHWLNHGKSEEKIAYIYLEDVNFDWILYINNYPDLYNAGICTENSALDHWITHGKNEDRVCDKNIIESVYHQGKYYKGEYHKKYCNSTKEKHKHKLIPDYNTKRVKDKCCFRCGEKSHYIIDCKYPNI